MAPASSRRHADSPEETEGLLHAPGRDAPVEEEGEACSREGEGGRAEDVEKPASTTSTSPSLVVPALTKSTVSGPLSPSSGGDGKAGDMVSLCRICLEEDAPENLAIPCSCSGTQRWAHHSCIQQWVSEKGNIRCEVCGTDYRGEFTIPPPPPPSATAPQMLAPMFILNAESAARIAAARHHIQVLEAEQDEYQQRHPGMSCVFTACVFILFLVVMHHTMVVAENGDGTDPYPNAPSAPPMPADGSGTAGADDITMFFFWVATKAIFIGVPLWIMLRVASRQARREQYEQMLRGVTYDADAQAAASGRRMVFRMPAGFGTAAGGAVIPPPQGINAV